MDINVLFYNAMNAMPQLTAQSAFVPSYSRRPPGLFVSSLSQQVYQ